MRRTLAGLAAEAVPGQLPMFGDADPAPAPLPVVKVRPSTAGEKWTRHVGGRECADCWADQGAALEAGDPVPMRQPVRWCLTTGTERVYLCGTHAAKRGHDTTSRRSTGRARRAS